MKRWIEMRRLIFLLSCFCLASFVFGWTRLPTYEGFIRLRVLSSSPDMVFCTLEVSGETPSELLAIEVKDEPKILWEITSKGKNWDIFTGSYAWDVIWIDRDIVYTLEGSVLQKRRRKDGVVLKELNVSALITPASEARPWDDTEEMLEDLKHDPEGKRDEIAALAQEIAQRKSEWERLEGMTRLHTGGTQTWFERIGFLGVTKNSICVSRVRYHLIAGGAQKVFEEKIFLDPERLKILPPEKVQWEEKPQIPNVRTPYPYQLHVLGNVQLKTMAVEEKKTAVALAGSDPKKKKTLWRLEIPVIMKRIPNPDVSSE